MSDPKDVSAEATGGGSIGFAVEGSYSCQVW